MIASAPNTRRLQATETSLDNGVGVESGTKEDTNRVSGRARKDKSAFQVNKWFIFFYLD